MWVWLDCVGSILFDATLSTVFFLSCVVLAMLGCRQPSRRILIARASLIASLAMVPIVALAPLPRIDVIGAAIRAKLLPAAIPAILADTTISMRHSGQTPPSPVPTAALRRIEVTSCFHDGGPWVLRCITLLFLACVTIGVAWLALGFWGVCWLLGNSREPSPTDHRALRSTRSLPVRSLRARPGLRVIDAGRASRRGRHDSPDDLDPADV